MSRILIVDDDAQLRKSFSKILKDRGHEVELAASGEQCLERVAKGGVDLVIQDVRLPGIDGLETFRRLRELPLQTTPLVIVMTAYGAMETAVEATRLGAFDYLLKPFDIPQILELIDKALDTIRRQREDAAATSATDDAESPPEDEDAAMTAILGNSSAMQEVFKAIGRVAPTDATVLVRGESGTGKELVARAIYKYSSRANGPFAVINCVAIPETLLESELFGYEKGAFTGAASRRVGKIEQAQRGTIFLDEIGDMPLSIQAKLLRLLQEKQIQRLGGGAPIPVDVRIIAATNRDLEQAVKAGSFREDLYFRLEVVSITLPPLRERREDIPLLARMLMSRQARMMDLPNPGVTDDALEVLARHAWPGNVRELSNCMQKAVIFSKGAPLSATDAERALQQSAGAINAPDPQRFQAMFREWARESLLASDGGKAYDDAMDAASSALVTAALEMTEGNRTRAARLLGVSRPTLLAKIDKHGISIGAKVAAGGDSGASR